ncbi:ATP-binding protein [Streptomyces sp. URMC 124]|uniref:ATP-binding protein n=1 Tax=Streptomyces sp. URMC 124 TaxID=3423405 RepID=UPI003F1D9412
MRTAMLTSVHTDSEEGNGRPSKTYRLSAPASPTTARVAREFVSAALQATAHTSLIENALVCVSDLVTNVVQHTPVHHLSVEVTASEERVVISVLDGDAGRRPWRRTVRAGQEDGRGLRLVRSLSVDSGVTLVWDELNVVGKCVWFEPRAETGS